MSVDLPEPDTPVIQVMTPIGICRLTFFKLLPLAPSRRIYKGSVTVFLPFLISPVLALWRIFGISMRFLPDKYCPVNELSFLAISSAVPVAMTRPPCTPAPTPMSMMWSAVRMASSSCSTTITVLPRSRRCVSVDNRRSLSRWCKPMDGSSSTYMTPISPAPIWLARRIRWASPPDNVSAERARVRYSKPTLVKKPKRSRISLKILSATSPLCPPMCRFS